MINNNSCIKIENVLRVMNEIQSLKSDSPDFKSKELSSTYLIEFMKKQKLVKAFQSYKDLLPKNIKALIFSKDGYYNSLDIKSFSIDKFVEYFYLNFDCMIPTMILILEIFASDVIERSKSDSKVNAFLNDIKSEIMYFLMNISSIDISTEHIEVDPFDFYTCISNNNFNKGYNYIYDAEAMKDFIDIFGGKMIPPQLYEFLIDKSNKKRDRILYELSRDDFYYAYEVGTVCFSKNSFNIDDIKLISIDNDYGEYNYCYASYSYVYSNSIDNFIKNSSKEDVSKLLYNIEKLYEYSSIEKITYTKPRIVKKGDLLYDKFNTDGRCFDNYIVMGEFNWICCSWHPFSRYDILMHTKYYLDEVNKMLEGY